jgi:hypothetical protein
MPNVNVTERTVSPRLDQGLLTGLIAGAVVAVWMILIGALGEGHAADQGVFTSSIVLGPKVFSDSVGFGAHWLIGEVVHFVTFGLIGIVWALGWPKIRRFGTWTPALLFGIVMYLVVVQVISRIIQPGLPTHLGFSGLWIGYILAGFVFAYRYRGA